MQLKFEDVNMINEDGEQENEPIITRTCSGCLSSNDRPVCFLVTDTLPRFAAVFDLPLIDQVLQIAGIELVFMLCNL